MIPDYLYVNCFHRAWAAYNDKHNLSNYHESINIGISHAKMKEKYYKEGDKEYYLLLGSPSFSIIMQIANRLYTPELTCEEFIIQGKAEYEIHRIMSLV